jgi:hypothetical protein
MLKEGDRVRLIKSGVCDNLGAQGTILEIFIKGGTKAAVKWDTPIWTTEKRTDDTWSLYLAFINAPDVDRLEAIHE